MESFPLRPLSRFQQPGPSTTIRRPREFTFFSFDHNRDLKYRSEESLRYYFPPFFAAPGAHTPRLDLCNGFDSYIKADETIDHHLDGVLDALQMYEEGLLAGGTKPEDVPTKADVVTWRGMMTKVLTSAYDHFGDFEMNATCYQGTIYIEENYEFKRSEPARPQNRGGPSQAMMSYWGHKFENLCVLRQPWSETPREAIEARDGDVVNDNEQYCSIVQTVIGSTSLVLAGEVDCVLGEKPTNADDPIPWVELKTSAEMGDFHNPREVVKWERKLLKFWAQSFLLGVPKVVVGFRSPQGLLTRLEDLEVRRLPGVVTRGQKTWDGNVCVKMAEGFLEFLKEKIGGREGVFRIKKAEKGAEITVTRLEEKGTGSILKPAFKEHREKLMTATAAARPAQ